MSIQSKITEIKGCLPSNVALVAVSKTYHVSDILTAYQGGQRIFGESRPQELCAKHDQLPKDIEWHMIGHLQTNKVRSIVPFVSLIHSVDSIKVLKYINKEAAAIGRTVDVLLEILIAQEESKYGFTPDEIVDYLTRRDYESLNNVRFRGVMCIASDTKNIAQIKDEFSTIYELHSQLKERFFDNRFDIISMGMSADYESAIECGSNMVRIGSMIFGERQYIK